MVVDIRKDFPAYRASHLSPAIDGAFVGRGALAQGMIFSYPQPGTAKWAELHCRLSLSYLPRHFRCLVFTQE